MTATYALALAGLAFLAAITAFALIFTSTHPIEQETPWTPEQPSNHPPQLPSSSTS